MLLTGEGCGGEDAGRKGQKGLQVGRKQVRDRKELQGFGYTKIPDSNLSGIGGV